MAPKTKKANPYNNLKAKTKKKQQLGVWVDPQIYQLAKHKAIDENINPGKLVERALRKYLAIEEK